MKKIFDNVEEFKREYLKRKRHGLTDELVAVRLGIGKRTLAYYKKRAGLSLGLGEWTTNRRYQE